MDRRDHMATYGGLPTGIRYDPFLKAFVHGQKSEKEPCPNASDSDLPACGECQPCLDEDHGAYFCIPSKFEVCGTCLGAGTHVNPSIDAHGITSEEWENDWDEESREAYRSGGYDVTCSECNGLRVVPVPDESRATPEAMKAWEEIVKDDAQYRAECESERRMGA